MPAVDTMLKGLAGIASKAKGFRPSLKGALHGLGLPGVHDLTAMTTGSIPSRVAGGLNALGGAAFLGGTAVSGAKWLFDWAKYDVAGEGLAGAVKAEFGDRARIAGLRMEGERRAAEIAVNAQRLAQSNPRLYQQLLAGRKLPRGAIVIGGAPRTDLLEEFARTMGNDARNPEVSASDEYLRALTGS